MNSTASDTLQDRIPRVTVIIPTYNSARYIVQTVESVFAQTYADYELIVIDDGSTDNTRELLAPYATADTTGAGSHRLTYLYQANAGESVARNNGIRRARGEYVAFLDSDDWWTPDKLALQVQLLDNAPNAVMAYSYSFVVDNDGNPTQFQGSPRVNWGEAGVHDMFARIVIGNVVGNPNTVLARRAAVLQTTLFDEDIEWGEDWQLWLNLARVGPFLFTPKETAYYRLRRPGRRLEIEASDVFVEQNELILKRAFQDIKANHAHRADWLRLEPVAMRELFVRSALYNFELGDIERGKRHLARVAEADPTYASTRINGVHPLAQLIADTGFRIGSDAARTSASSDAGYQKGLTFIERVFTHMPPSMSALQATQGQAIAELHMAAAFAAHANGVPRPNRSQVLNHVVHAMRNHWPNVRNRGLWAIAFKSILPNPNRG